MYLFCSSPHCAGRESYKPKLKEDLPTELYSRLAPKCPDCGYTLLKGESRNGIRHTVKFKKRKTADKERFY